MKTLGIKLEIYLLSTRSCFGEQSEREELWILTTQTIGEILASKHLLWLAILIRHIWVYLNEQVASKIKLDQKPEHHACKHQLDDVPDASDSCISSILNLKLTLSSAVYTKPIKSSYLLISMSSI